jgi:peptidoglycan endopeptidase LytE
MRVAVAMLLTMLRSEVAVAAQERDGSGSDTYTVQVGDTLSMIARQTGVGVNVILEVNHLVDPDAIFAGTVLRLPAPPALPVPVRGSTERAGQTAQSREAATAGTGQLISRTQGAYTVRSGDTLSSIAGRLGISTAELVEANALAVPDRLELGQVLLVPPVAQGAQSTRLSATAREGARPETGGPAASMGSRPAVFGAPIGPARRGSITPPGPAPAPLSSETASPGRYPTGAEQVPRRVSVVPATASGQTFDGATLTAVSYGMELGLPARNHAHLAVQIALGYIGHPYVYGGTAPSGFDCSGFVHFVQHRAGREIPRDLLGQYEAGSHPLGALESGDLVFFRDTHEDGLSHSGIYLGNGQFIHAVNETSGVDISSLNDPYYAERWYGATRLR